MSWHAAADGRRSARPKDYRLRPMLEDLESRALLSTIVEYPGSYQFPSGIVAGKGGVLWTADAGKDTLTEVSADGKTLATYAIPNRDDSDISLAVATDGRVWFSSRTLGEIGVLDPTTGKVTIDTLPADHPYATGLVAGPGGSIGFIASGAPATWYGQASASDGIGRIGPDGTLSFTATPGVIPTSVLVGTGGAVSFVGRQAADGSPVLGRVAADGSIATTPLPADFARPTDLQAGADGSIWFFNPDIIAGKLAIGRVAADGIVSEFPMPKVPDMSNGLHAPFDLRIGPDGSLYYLQAAQVVRMTPDGSFATFALPGVGWEGAQDGLHATIGGDGALWFDYYAGISTPAPGVGRLTLGGDAGWTPIGNGSPKSPPPPMPNPPVVVPPPIVVPPPVVATPPIVATPGRPQAPSVPTAPVTRTGPIVATPIVVVAAPVVAPAQPIAAPSQPIAAPAQDPIPAPDDASGSWLPAPVSLYGPAPQAADPLTVVGQAHPGAKSARTTLLTLVTAPLLG